MASSDLTNLILMSRPDSQKLSELLRFPYHHATMFKIIFWGSGISIQVQGVQDVNPALHQEEVNDIKQPAI